MDEEYIVEWLTTFRKLPKNQQQIITKHIDLSDSILKWASINMHLIDEFHYKKIKRNFGRVECGNMARQFYEKILFRGNKYITHSDPFPDEIFSALKTALANELGNCKLDVGAIYEEDMLLTALRKNKPLFNEKHWVLDKTTDLTHGDIDVLHNFRFGLIYSLEKSLVTLKKYNPGDYSKCRKITREMKKMMSSIVV